jgi:hypothetical protein
LKKSLQSLAEKVVSALPARRKAQLLDITLSHIGEVSYYRLAKHGFRPNGIVDIGAYHGEWSRTIARFYPHTPILMIEAQAEKRPQLEAVHAKVEKPKIEAEMRGELDIPNRPIKK